MSLAIAIISFLLLVAVLSSLRTRLVHELLSASLLLFNTLRPGQILYSLMVLPGTIIHELSHWLVAELLHVRTGKIVILPDFAGEGDTKRLGSVEAAKSDPFRSFFIGLAPFISGLAILFVLSEFLRLGWGVYPWWILAFIIYGIMVVGNSMLISAEDRRAWPVVFVLLTLIGFTLYKTGLSLPEAFIPWVIASLKRLDLVLGVTASFNLVMILGLYLVRRLIEKMSGRRLV